ncbi:PAS domain-containing protein [Romeria aff. gracilis LEGE 07310]|uniref:PAS domain-containing protein n=1 Tax=Vasconcelosia minhoensis LEGE 07310 TaxID=915328 RepID=A0A8J7AZQ4_9CYAN|nr:CheR family methyltransferase [Romeria gracilis]MBE9079407.1 PAS domain-containing protein [Romeria aff. gracilis LEGE 07310]
MANPPAQQSSESRDRYPIVGIGASAGGLKPTSELLSQLPTNMGMAFVLIQHLAPDRHSLLTELLANQTTMPVNEITDGMAIAPNCVYVIAPDTQITIDAERERFQVEARNIRPGQFMPIDHFFHSLAKTWDSSAIGIVLSGSNGDGALGLKAIRAAGGITMAQCEGTAQFSQMPNTAAATGDVDFILPPVEIARELVRISQHPYVQQPESPPQAAETPAAGATRVAPLNAVFGLLLRATGVDFTHYKHNTFSRRLRRRMALYKLEALEDYVAYVENHPEELQALYQDVLLTVTSFFRDADTFAALSDQVLPRILNEKSADSTIRVWVAGCATGEECYSIAICLLELLATQRVKPNIQIFGTDISDVAIDKARTGIYAESHMTPVSAERRRRFFVEVESGYQVNRSVREMCVFARQNLISDPPFSNLDLVSCRNVLIYFASVLQKRVLPIFHYSLNPTGFLLLGRSESIGEASDLFRVVDKQHRLYSRAAISSGLSFDYISSDHLMVATKPSEAANVRNELNVKQQADQIILRQYAPDGVVVNHSLDILQFRGDTSAYLRPAAGEPSFNLLKMIRPELLLEVRTAINQARRRGDSATQTKQREGSALLDHVSIEVIPFSLPEAEEPYLLVLFSPIAPPAEERAADPTPPEAQPEIMQLRRELAEAKQELLDTQAHLQTTIEDQEATNQSLTTANEEILSSNEELQSINEELQTAKEEIQAANEELKTTNEELHSRNQEARLINDDLLNLLSNVNIPILMLSSDLGIRRFTPAAQRIFNLISSDVGRPISHIRLNIDLPDLEDLIMGVIDSLTVQDREVQDREGRWHLLRVRPYKTMENQIDGAVLALVDIDDLKRTQARLEVARDYAESIVETVRQPLLVLNTELQVLSVNRAFYDTFQVSPEETEGRLILELGNGQWDIQDLRSRLEDILPDQVELQDFEIEHDFESIGPRTMLLNAREFTQGNEGRKILLAIEDISDRKQAEAERTRLLLARQAQAEAEAENIRKNEFLSMLSHELRTPLNSILGWSDILLRRPPKPEVLTRALEAIQRGARSQARLIEDLLDLSRIIQGKLQLTMHPTNLTRVMQSVIETLQPDAERKQIRLEANLAPAPASILADAERLQQVFLNLLTNAIKFTPEGGQVAVQLTYSQTVIQIQVADSGKGISADMLPYIFDRFRQDDSSTTRSYGGLGLGLAIVRYLVEAHNGTVAAASDGEGQGATFIVSLPLVVANTPAEPAAAPPDPGRDCLTGLRLLLVDDQESNLDPLTFVLETQGATVVTANSAAAAMAQIEAQPPDLLISDVGMPHMNGLELVRWVRSRPAEQGGEMPAIALTAFAAEAEAQDILAAGFQHHLAKPVSLDDVVAVVARLINH